MNSLLLKEQATRPNEPGTDMAIPDSYRVLSKSAIASLVFAILGLISWLHEIFVVIPAIGIAFGLVSWLGFRRFPGELIGKPVMRAGLTLSLLCFFVSIANHIYVYNTEVPENHTRISFAMLKENPRRGLTYNEKARELDGKKVFVKGYVRPGDKKKNLKQFILVGDFGSCCFGGNPKISEVIAIDVKSDKTVNYGYRLRRVTGTFRFIEQAAMTSESEVPLVHYLIEADDVY